MKQYAMRGATTVAADTADEIQQKTMELVELMVQKNGITPNDCVCLTATTTVDIHAAYPVRFVRESGILGDTPMFSAVEPDIDGGLPLCVRVLLLVQFDREFAPKHVYLHGAAALRKDLKS